MTPKDPRLNPAMSVALTRARVAWADRHEFGTNARVVASFDDMLDAFASDCMRFSHIALALGVSRQAVNQLWNRYFRHLFGERSGRRRWKTCTLMSGRAAMRDAQPIGLAGEVAAIATRIGLPATAITRKYSGTVKIRRKALTVNGHVVLIASTRVLTRTNERSLHDYYHFTYRRRGTRRAADFMVLKCGDPVRFWIVMPWDEWQSWNGGIAEHRYVPEQPCDYIPAMGKTAWIWQYRDAWHLLR